MYGCGKTQRRFGARGGQVLLIMLLALTCLVGLVFYVYNLGDQVHRRLSLQNTADAVAISGAVSLTRSMNVVAMNNVAQSRMISLVPIMDAFPAASEIAHEEVTEWEKCLAAQLARGVPSTKGEYLRKGLESLRARMADQRDVLRPVTDALNRGGFRMEEATTWSVRGVGGAPPHGSLFRAAATLDEFSRATLQAAGPIAQADAVRFGKINRADASFLVPVLPGIPHKIGAFADFQPVLQGYQDVRGDEVRFRRDRGAGGAIVDCVFPYRLGPWARLFRWRHYYHRATAWGKTGSGPGSRIRGGSGNVNVPGRRVGDSARTRAGGGERRRATEWELRGYTTYGPYYWAMRRITHYTQGYSMRPGRLADTYFYSYLQQLSNIKLGYMFGPKTTRTIHRPIWFTHYPRAKEIAEDLRYKVTKTMFYLVEVASSVPEDSPKYMTSGTYRTNGKRPIAMWVGGWRDPAEWGIPKLADYVWKDAYTYETTYDPEIGIRQKKDSGGNVVFQTVYMVAWYVFGGVDTGVDMDVSNPCNWDKYDQLPAPSLLETAEGDDYTDDPDGAFRRRYFTCLGVARKNDRAAVWSQRFAGANPMNSMVALAQVKMFNSSSWDLWTQDWQAQLAPVSGWDQWIALLETGASDAGATDGVVSVTEVERVGDYLSKFTPDLVEMYMKH